MDGFLDFVRSTEGAAWGQTILSAVAIFVAIYIPVRLRRLGELEAIKLCVDRAGALAGDMEYYWKHAAVVGKQIPNIGVQIQPNIDACWHLAREPSIPSDLAAAMAKVAHGATLTLEHWRGFLAHHHSPGPEHGHVINTRLRPLREGRDEAISILSAWRKRHWFSTVFSGR